MMLPGGQLVPIRCDQTTPFGSLARLMRNRRLMAPGSPTSPHPLTVMKTLSGHTSNLLILMGSPSVLSEVRERMPCTRAGRQTARISPTYLMRQAGARSG